MTIGTFGGGTRRVAYQQAVAKLAAVRATRQVLDQRDGETRQLLAFDVSGRSARVAVAVGDVDRAGHVAVVVPGFTTTVERDLVGSDRVSADLVAQSRRAASLVDDSREVAVVSWLAYDVPQTADTLRSGHSVVLRASAEAGADTAGVLPSRALTGPAPHPGRPFVRVDDRRARGRARRHRRRRRRGPRLTRPRRRRTVPTSGSRPATSTSSKPTTTRWPTSAGSAETPAS